jgi:hypothetical protein
MIYLGYARAEKEQIITEYQVAHDIRKTVVIAPERFPLTIAGADQVGYADVIMYVTFYRLLQEIDRDTLVVLHECLRTQNRYDLAYNCIRNYLNRTGHVLIFQTLPQIDEQEDFMVLFDWATQSRWKRRHFDAELIRTEAQVSVREWPLALRRIDVPTSAATQRKYAQERERLFAELGARDPHTLPRNLYLLGGRDKQAFIAARAGAQSGLCAETAAPQWFVARNKRLGAERMVTYDDVQPGQQYTVVEFPHRFIDWCDFVTFTGQAASRVLVADLPVDRWYFDRYVAWKERIDVTYASLRG